MISLEKGSILPNKLPNNAGDLGKLIVAEGFKNLPKSNKSPNLVTQSISHTSLWLKKQLKLHTT